ncbi:sorting nexin-20 isoform X1 [Pygocentrus nattereri]|uniref:sorting nexin-20 isoform X1 n=2 Tax=Pygocentrus nattereri TaxID=42514 RepID=UPI00081466E1|nr:sorting nexin-20 isoform X1 [Pygocentrus nattereri]
MICSHILLNCAIVSGCRFKTNDLVLIVDETSSLQEQNSEHREVVVMDSDSPLLHLRTDGERGSSNTHSDEPEHQQEPPLGASPGISASCLTTAELQQHWRAVKQEIRCIKLLFEIPSARTIEQASSKYVVYQIVVIRSGSYDRERVAIERRYSDFFHLHQQLLQDFSEELEEVMLPKKKLVGNFSEENISERRVALCDYLTQLYARRYIRRTRAFIAFFTHPELKTAYDLLRGGRFSQALEVLEKALVLQRKLSTHDQALLVPTLCALVVCQRDLGDIHDAFQTGHMALPAVRRYGFTRYRAPLLEAMVDLGYKLEHPVAQLQEELIKVQNSPHGPVSLVSLKELVVQEFT